MSYLQDEEFGRLINQKFPFFYKDYSKTVKFEYFMNHCIHCNMKQGDFFVYHEWTVELLYEEEITIKLSK